MGREPSSHLNGCLTCKVRRHISGRNSRGNRRFRVGRSTCRSEDGVAVTAEAVTLILATIDRIKSLASRSSAIVALLRERHVFPVAVSEAFRL